MKEVLFWSVCSAFLILLLLVGHITPESHRGTVVMWGCVLLTAGLIVKIWWSGR